MINRKRNFILENLNGKLKINEKGVVLNISQVIAEGNLNLAKEESSKS